MTTLTTRQMQMDLLQILTDIYDYCDANGLRCCLWAGTMLGAVRHKGFIPWDDDADLVMPRKDFERFVAGYNDSRKDSPFRCIYRDKVDGADHFTAWAKIWDRRTAIIDRSGHENDYGINVDIFPLDGLPADKSEADRFARHASHLCHRLYLKGQKLWPLNFHNPLIPLISAHLHSKEHWFDKVEAFATRYDYDSSETVMSVCERYDINFPFPRTMFEDLVDYEFEGLKFKGMADYDLYLKTQYGDYMTLPPEDKRQVHHASTAWTDGPLPGWMD